MRKPPILNRLQAVLTTHLDKSLFDENWTWKHIHLAQRLRGAYTHGIVSTKKDKLTLLRHAQKMIAPLGCSQLSPKWSNLSYCPPGPHGAYHWLFQCEIVQEALWQHKEFVQGYCVGMKPSPSSPPSRDSNPWPDPARQTSWDCGYILGRNHPEIALWCRAKKNQMGE